MCEYKKKILITGATHGIGAAVAEKFLHNDWEVYGCGSNLQDPRGPQMEMKFEKFHFSYADVSCEEEIEKFLTYASPVQVAFNNAGIGCAPGPAHLMDTGAAERIMAVNLLGTALCMKHETMKMLGHGNGIIINSSSVAAFKAATGANPIYAATKAGIAVLGAEAAANRIYKDKIKFFTVVPGWIETRMTATDNKQEWAAKLPSGRVGVPEEVADLIYTIVIHSDCFNSGQKFHISGGGYLL